MLGLPAHDHLQPLRAPMRSIRSDGSPFHLFLASFTVGKVRALGKQRQDIPVSPGKAAHFAVQDGGGSLGIMKAGHQKNVAKSKRLKFIKLFL